MRLNRRNLLGLGMATIASVFAVPAWANGHWLLVWNAEVAHTPLYDTATVEVAVSVGPGPPYCYVLLDYGGNLDFVRIDKPSPAMAIQKMVTLSTTKYYLPSETHLDVCAVVLMVPDADGVLQTVDVEFPILGH